MASKYARIEIERRFLLAGVPEGVEVAVALPELVYLDRGHGSTVGGGRTAR